MTQSQTGQYSDRQKGSEPEVDYKLQPVEEQSIKESVEVSGG